MNKTVALLEAGKPVFDSEHLDRALKVVAPTIDSICGSTDAKWFQTVFKEIDLNDWVGACAGD